MKRRNIIIVFVALISFCGLAAGADDPGRFSVGLNYPGFSVRYRGGKGLIWEAKTQFDTGITVIGGRLSKYFKKEQPKLRFIKGIELDYVSFKSEETTGVGMASEAFIGGEYFVTKKLSVQLDLGPAFIFVKDNSYGLSANSLEFVANFGIYLYF